MARKLPICRNSAENCEHLPRNQTPARQEIRLKSHSRKEKRNWRPLWPWNQWNSQEWDWVAGAVNRIPIGLFCSISRSVGNERMQSRRRGETAFKPAVSSSPKMEAKNGNG